MKVALLLPDDSVLRIGSAAVRAALAGADGVDLLCVGPAAARSLSVGEPVLSGPTRAQRLVAAAIATDAEWVAWCPPDRVGVSARFVLQAGIGESKGAWFVTCGLIGSHRAPAGGGQPPAELIRPGPTSAWTGRLDVLTAVIRRDMLKVLPPTDQVGDGALVALATRAALSGAWLHVNHPVAAPAPRAADGTGDAGLLSAERRTALRLQELSGGLEVLHTSDSPNRDQLMQHLLPLMLRAAEEWTEARRALDMRPVRPRWTPSG